MSGGGRVVLRVVLRVRSGQAFHHGAVDDVDDVDERDTPCHPARIRDLERLLLVDLAFVREVEEVVVRHAVRVPPRDRTRR